MHCTEKQDHKEGEIDASNDVDHRLLFKSFLESLLIRVGE
jgi:hypothetical protein